MTKSKSDLSKWFKLILKDHLPSKPSRPKERIAPILQRLQVLWEANPDLRLGQMISNAARGSDPYYIEDEQLLSDIEKIHKR